MTEPSQLTFDPTWVPALLVFNDPAEQSVMVRFADAGQFVNEEFEPDLYLLVDDEHRVVGWELRNMPTSLEEHQEVRGPLEQAMSALSIAEGNGNAVRVEAAVCPEVFQVFGFVAGYGLGVLRTDSSARDIPAA